MQEVLGNRAVTPLSAEPGIVGGVVRHVDDDQRQRRAVVINAIGGQVGSRTCASPMPPIRCGSNARAHAASHAAMPFSPVAYECFLICVLQYVHEQSQGMKRGSQLVRQTTWLMRGSAQFIERARVLKADAAQLRGW